MFCEGFKKMYISLFKKYDVLVQVNWYYNNNYYIEQTFLFPDTFYIARKNSIDLERPLRVI